MFDGWRGLLDFAGVLMKWNRSDMHLTSGVAGVARVRCSFKSGVHEWRWPTQAQLMRSDILRNTDVLGRSVSGVFCRYLQEDGESACVGLVLAVVIRPVLLCSVMWRCVLSATCSCKYHLYVYRMEYCQ